MATSRSEARAVDEVDGLRERAKTAHAAASGAALAAECAPGQRWTWELVEVALSQLRQQLAVAQSKVRALARKERRAACNHPGDLRRTFADGSAKCRNCGTRFQAPNAGAGRMT